MRRWRQKKRILLEGGLWLNQNEDGTISLGGYDYRLELLDLRNHADGSILEVRAIPLKPDGQRRLPVRRRGDYVPAEVTK